MKRKKLIELGILILFLFAFGCPHGIPPNSHISEGIQKIAEIKSKCEQWAGKVKKDFSYNSHQYLKANELYIETKSAFDGWIERLKFDLTAEVNISESIGYETSLKEASAKSDAFLKYVKELYPPEQKAVPIIDILSSLTDAGIKIWQEYKKAQDERKKEIKSELERFKLKPFNEL